MLFILGSRLLHSSKQHQYSHIPDLDVNVPVITVHGPTVNLLLPTSPVLCCTPDFHPAGPPLLSGFFSHCSSPCGFRPYHFSLPFRLPLHHDHAVIIPPLSEHVANPIPSSPSNFITDLLYACCMGNCVVSDGLWPPNPFQACELK